MISNGPVTYLYPVQQTMISQPIVGTQGAGIAPSVTYIIAPAPPSMVAPHNVPTRHMAPFEIKCYACNETGLTSVSYSKSAFQWLSCLIIALVGGWIFCLCFVPFCFKSLRNYEHSCCHCGTSVAYKDPLK